MTENETDAVAEAAAAEATAPGPTAPGPTAPGPTATPLSSLLPWGMLALVVFVAASAFALGILVGGGGGPGAAIGGGASAEHEHEEGTEYTCAMHPEIRSDEPGSCPICGMDLVPVDSSSGGHAPDDQVTLTERAKVLARIRTERVGEATAADAREVRLLGRVDYDETSQRTVTSWVAGRIDRLRVRVTGQSVRRGQVVATLYSPEVYGAHQDLLHAKRQVARLAQASELTRGAAEASLEAARERLRLLGVPAADLRRLEAATRPTRALNIRSPFAGTVIERVASEGAYVTTGAPLYRLADLDRLWVQLDAYESDLGAIALGQTVTFSVDAFPGDSFEGEVAFIDPVVDVERRTTRVRVTVQNDGRLRPGMFATAIVAARSAASSISISASAPLFTGRRSVVYVEVPGADAPTYQVRPVRLGDRQGDRYPVLAGLRAGERVVVHGAFVLDADLQLRGGVGMMRQPDDGEPSPLDVVGELPPEFRAGLTPVLEAYLALQAALADDDLEAGRAHATRMAAAAAAFTPSRPTDAARVWRDIAGTVATATEHLHHVTDLAGLRGVFGGLTAAALRTVNTLGNPLATPVRRAHCPMALGNQGGDWLQLGETVDNPYFGEAMLTCGSVEETFEPSTAAEVAQPAPPSGRRPATSMARSPRPRGPTPMSPPSSMAVDHSMHRMPSASMMAVDHSMHRMPSASMMAVDHSMHAHHGMH